MGLLTQLAKYTVRGMISPVILSVSKGVRNKIEAEITLAKRPQYMIFFKNVGMFVRALTLLNFLSTMTIFESLTGSFSTKRSSRTSTSQKVTRI